MLKRDYFARLKALFFEKGISRRHSNHLIEELQDHVNLKEAEFKVEGANEAEAERLAMDAVGAPEAIAETASTELYNNSWLLRWAWLPCGAGIFIASFLLMIAIIFSGYYLAGGDRYDNGDISLPNLAVYHVEIFLFNWLPLLIGMGALACLIRFSSIGWRSIFVIAIALGIAVSGVDANFEISSVVDTDKLAFFRISSSELFQRLFNLPWFPEPIRMVPAVFKFFAPLGMCLFARYSHSLRWRRGQA